MSRLLTLLASRKRLVLPASVLAARAPALGAFVLDEDAVRGDTLADNGYNLVGNGEFTTDTAGWSSTNGIAPSRVDSGTEPGVASGGVDPWAMKGTKNGGSTLNGSGFRCATVIGSTYIMRGRVYSPSTNAEVKVAGLVLRDVLGWAVSATASVSAEDVWQSLSVTGVASAVDAQPGFGIGGVTVGDVGYFDSGVLYRQNALLPLPPLSPNTRLVADLPMPASGVTPRGLWLRGKLASGALDPLNGWEVRLLPNTAGTDCQIIEVVDGVETVRASADVDWTAGQTDRVLVEANGSTISVYHRKHGAAVYTLACSYASALTNTASPHCGLVAYGTAALCSYVEVEAL